MMVCACVAATAPAARGQAGPANPPAPQAGQTAPAPAPQAGQAPPAAAPQPLQTAAPQTRPAESQRTSGPKRKVWSIGLRARDFPEKSMSVMQTRTILATTTKTGEPVRDWNFTTTSHSPFWGAGLAAEFSPSDRWAISAEIMFNQLKYAKVSSITWGTDDPTTTTDERTHMFRNEDTRASLFDLPVIVHHNFRAAGPWSRVFWGLGATFRTVVNGKSSVQTTYPDTSSLTVSQPAPVSKRNVLGAVAGIGFRVIDDFNITWTPEVRFTRWTASTFANDSTLSPRNQLEVGLGFTF
jgi:hypothetical protein